MLYVLQRHPDIETTCSAARREAEAGAGATPK
jgi:hypothetical protein